MKHKPLFAGLCVLAVVLMCFVAYAADEEAKKEEPITQLCENVYFQKSTVNDYGMLHLRGKLLGKTLMYELAVVIYETEGIVTITPQPHTIYMNKSPIYTWEEILVDMCEAVQHVLEEAKKKLPNCGKTGV